jgi:hypothetical protein
MSNLEINEENPLQIFLYDLRAPESKRQGHDQRSRKRGKSHDGIHFNDKIR